MESNNNDNSRKNNQIDDKELFGRLIRQKRQEKGLSIDELAEKAEISSKFLGGIERGRDMPSLANTVNIANALMVGIDALLGDNLLINKFIMNDIQTNFEELPTICNDKEKKLLLELLKVYKSL